MCVSAPFTGASFLAAAAAAAAPIFSGTPASAGAETLPPIQKTAGAYRHTVFAKTSAVALYQVPARGGEAAFRKALSAPA